MIIELPDSKQKVRLVILHTNKDIWLEHCRCTIVKLENPDTKKILCEGIACCSLQDNFCKLTGRRIACLRMLQDQSRISNLKAIPGLSKADRRAIFQAVCPSFFKTKVRAIAK